MGETRGRVVMIETAFSKEAGVLENMIGSENVRHATKTMGRGEKRIEASITRHTNGQAEEGSDGFVLKEFLTCLEFAFQQFTNSKCTRREEKKCFCGQEEK